MLIFAEGKNKHLFILQKINSVYLQKKPSNNVSLTMMRQLFCARFPVQHKSEAPTMNLTSNTRSFQVQSVCFLIRVATWLYFGHCAQIDKSFQSGVYFLCCQWLQWQTPCNDLISCRQHLLSSYQTHSRAQQTLMRTLTKGHSELNDLQTKANHQRKIWVFLLLRRQKENQRKVRTQNHPCFQDCLKMSNSSEMLLESSFPKHKL